MVYKKKCAICGSENTFDNEVKTCKILTPHKLEEKYYFNLWHTNVEMCDKCGFVSFNIEQCLNSEIINNINYLKINENEMVKQLHNYQQNNLVQFLKCGFYYNKINDKFNEALSYLQASEEVLRVVRYLKQELFDDVKSDNDLINNFLSYADKLFNYGIAVLLKLYNENKNNAELNIVLAGSLLDGDEKQELMGKEILNYTKQLKLSSLQKRTIKYLLKE